MPSKSIKKRVKVLVTGQLNPADNGVHTMAASDALPGGWAAIGHVKERDIEKYLHKRVKEAGGEHRRVQWLGRNGAPDDAVLLHGVNFVECKAPGEELKPHQAREHWRMKRHGVPVYVLDSYAMVDKFMAHILEQVAWEYS